MSCDLPTVDDVSAVRGWVYQIRAAFDTIAPLKFSKLTWGGKTPTAGTGLTWQLLIEESREDGAAVILDTDAVTVTDDPLLIGYNLDTALAGFERNGQYPGELWVTDPDFAKPFLLVEFIVDLSDPLRDGV